MYRSRETLLAQFLGTSVVLLGLALFHSKRPPSAPSHMEEDLARCEQILRAYSACSKNIEFHEKRFFFRLVQRIEEVPCTDGQYRNFYDRLAHPDIASILSISYPAGEVSLPRVRFADDPGRLRHESLLRAIYGADLAAVERNLVHVKFLGQDVLFNRQNGAAKALEAAGEEISRAISTDPELKRYLEPWLTGAEKLYDPVHGTDMTFAWRDIAGTDRLSEHSFATAIDLYDSHRREKYYWLWAEAERQIRSHETAETNRTALVKKLREENLKNFTPEPFVEVPWSLVKIFERHGFIWGGKWNHFDAMHFEYRPEFFPGFRPDCSS